MRKGGTGTARPSRARSLLGFVVLGALALVSAGCVPPVGANPGTFNVSPSPRARPVNVLQGGTVQFVTVVTNHGPASAPAVAFVDTLPLFTTFRSVTVTKGGCSAPDTNRRVGCLFGSLARAESVTVTIVVTAPTAIGARLVNTATSVTNPADKKSDDNTRTAVATVQPPDPNTATAKVPPGGTLTTRASAFDTDPTVSSVTLPKAGKTLALTLRERSAAQFCGATFCAGQGVHLAGLRGPFSAADPPRLDITYDATLGLVPSLVAVWMQNGTTPTAGTRLAACNGTAVTCVRSMHVFSASDAPSPDDVGDLRVELAVFSAGIFGAR